MPWRADLNRLRFNPKDGPDPIERVEEIERLIGVRIPADFRRFLLEVGGGHLPDALAECTIPTPFGEHNCTWLFGAADVLDLLDSNYAPRNMICIGYGHFGMTTCLSVAGLDHGQVFSLDTELRYYGDQEKLDSLPHLAPSIREFFRLRDADMLPERPWGYTNCYHLADSFETFLSQCHLAEPEANAG